MASNTLGLAADSRSAALTTVVGVGASKPVFRKRVEDTTTCSTPSCAIAAPALSARIAAAPARRTRVFVKPYFIRIVPSAILNVSAVKPPQHRHVAGLIRFA